MLVLFKPMNKTITEVNVRPSQPTYKLVDPDMLRRMMKRTGTGRPITTRELAAAAGLSHGTISNLLTGLRDEIPYGNTLALCAAIGVDHPMLFDPTGRCIPSTPQPDEDTAHADEEAVSA